MALDVSVSSYPRNILEPAIPGLPHERLAIQLAASTTYKKGQVVQQGSTDGKYETYDASKTVHMVLAYDCSTDASGNITVGSSDELGVTYKSVDAWFTGVFKAADLFKDNAGTAIDATCLGKIGKLMNGSLANGGLVWVK